MPQSIVAQARLRSSEWFRLIPSDAGSSAHTHGGPKLNHVRIDTRMRCDLCGKLGQVDREVDLTGTYFCGAINLSE